MPTGSSKGANSTRASMSQTSTKEPPSKAAAGRSQRLSLPTSRRTIWGTSSPTKPSSPEKLTAAPASRAAARIAINRTRPTCSPRLAALSSPSWSTFSSTERNRARAVPTARYQPLRPIAARVTPEKPPIMKLEAPARLSGASRVMVLLPAVRMLLFSTAWMRAPDNAKAPPARAAARVLGIRTWSRMRRTVPLPPPQRASASWARV